MGSGSDSVAVFENWTAGAGARRDTTRSASTNGRKFDAGWGRAELVTEEYGGRGLPVSYVLAFRRAESALRRPRRTEMFSVTQQLVAPTIAQWGTTEQGTRYVRAMLRTDIIACQLFSETEAGSDLAAVRTRAVRTATGGGHRPGTRCGPPAPGSPTSGVAVCRTDPGAPSTPASPCSWSRWMRRASPSADPADDRRKLASTRSTSTAFDSTTATGSGRVGKGWQVALDRAGRRATRRGQPRSGERRPGRRTGASLGRRLSEIERDRVADLVTRSYVQRVTGMRVAGGGGRRQRPRSRGLGRETAGHRHHGAHLRGGAPAARAAI